MGEKLHITRGIDGCDAGNGITCGDWRAWVEADPDLRLSDEAAPMLIAEYQTADGPLVWCKGRVDVKSPARALVQKMHALAQALDAQLPGDDGKLYGSDGPARPAGPPPPPRGFVDLLFGSRR
ncbi:MAG: hypothetical protein AAGE13_10930 [Pseudomonadota bacterium]